MASRLTSEQKAKARKFYIEYGYTNITELAALVNISRQGLTALRDKEKWDMQREHVTITPQEIARELLGTIADILKEIKDKRADKLAVAPSVKKDLVFYIKALRGIDEQYDIKGTMIVFCKMLIEFVAALPMKEFSDKKMFIEDLQKILIQFIGKIESGK